MIVLVVHGCIVNIFWMKSFFTQKKFFQESRTMFLICVTDWHPGLMDVIMNDYPWLNWHPLFLYDYPWLNLINLWDIHDHVWFIMICHVWLTWIDISWDAFLLLHEFSQISFNICPTHHFNSCHFHCSQSRLFSVTSYRIFDFFPVISNFSRLLNAKMLEIKKSQICPIKSAHCKTGACKIACKRR